ncbi:hypothetical protein [Desulfotignum phosphitoxidans]|uniref:hypothetical protein n=1 Tax=Desulfotignum phosphitoxidans TaxID=190898 RepID=UPI001360B44E|nr:hypothetical protein [Desulfotignum phosphitoxidans]
MNKTDIPIEWRDGSGETVEIGYLNPNGQQCGGHCGVPGIRYWKITKKIKSFKLRGKKQSSIHHVKTQTKTNCGGKG